MIAFHRRRPDYHPPHPNTIMFPYEDREFLKFTYQLMHSDNVLKAKILAELNDKFHNADRITLALLSSDLLTVLIKMIIHPESAISVRSILAIEQICSVTMGRQKIMQAGHLLTILSRINDQLPQIRYHAYKALLNFTEFLEGKDFALKTDMLDLLVDKLTKQDDEEILLLDLNLIQSLLEGGEGTPQVLKLRTIQKLTGLLSHQRKEIRRMSCQNLASISYNEVGKAEIISKGCVPPIFKGIKDECQAVKNITTICLASLCQLNDGKQAILAENDFEAISGMLHEKDENTVLNAVNLISSLAEHPKGRRLCEGVLEYLSILEGQVSEGKEYVREAIEIICWKP